MLTAKQHNYLIDRGYRIQTAAKASASDIKKKRYTLKIYRDDIKITINYPNADGKEALAMLKDLQEAIKQEEAC